MVAGFTSSHPRDRGVNVFRISRRDKLSDHQPGWHPDLHGRDIWSQPFDSESRGEFNVLQPSYRTHVHSDGRSHVSLENSSPGHRFPGLLDWKSSWKVKSVECHCWNDLCCHKWFNHSEHLHAGFSIDP